MKILQIGMGNVAGGLEAFVMNYYRVLVRMEVQFDFVCMYDKIAYEDEICRLGGRVYYIPNIKKDYRGYVKNLKQILRKENYDAVHVNMLSAANIVPLRVAHEMGVRKVIAHSHSSSCPGLLRNLMDRWNRPRISRYATEKVACAEIAGRWMFGSKAFEKGEVTVIQNAICADKFCFSAEERKMLREEMGWQGKIVIGHVGRFDIPKNHQRMVEILASLLQKEENAVLCLVGPKEGLYESVREKARKLGIVDKICFAGKQENIRRYLSAMDVFLFPSIFEGVPFALIEAQTNGLACVMSDAVSEEATVFPEAVKRLSLQSDNQIWADTLLQMSRLRKMDSDSVKQRLTEAHFDIIEEAQRLKQLYEE